MSRCFGLVSGPEIPNIYLYFYSSLVSISPSLCTLKVIFSHLRIPQCPALFAWGNPEGDPNDRIGRQSRCATSGMIYNNPDIFHIETHVHAMPKPEAGSCPASSPYLVLLNSKVTSQWLVWSLFQMSKSINAVVSSMLDVDHYFRCLAQFQGIFLVSNNLGDQTSAGLKITPY